MTITNSQLNEVASKIVNRFKKNPDDIPVHLMIKSWEDYVSHDINIFRDSLNAWSYQYNYQHSPFNFTTINIDKDNIGICNNAEALKHSRKVFFVNTTPAQLKQYHLDALINNENVISCSYMSEYTDMSVYFDRMIA